MEDFNPKCGCSGIGSIPHRHYKKVLDNILNEFDFPYWPQLFGRGFVENMYVQFSEKMPSLNIDFNEERLFFNTKDESSLYNFYEKIVDDDVNYFKISKKLVRGFYEFLKKADNLEYIKGQITGPISYSLAVLDQDRKPILYDQQFFEAVIAGLCMKTRWQVRKLREVSENVIMFFDEPYMQSFGSAYLSLDRETAIHALNEVINSAKKEGAITGIHCCGNTDWGLIMETDTDILSFDAYNFSDRLALYSKNIKQFLEHGSIAWGIVPTSHDIINEDVESLVQKLENKIQSIANKGIDKELILNKTMITPTCGAGSLYNKAADKVLCLTSCVSRVMKEKYF